MSTPLQSTNLMTNDIAMPAEVASEDEHGAEEVHVHMPNPSLWPLILGVSIVITIIGLLFIDSSPAMTIIGAVLVVISILGLGLEDPFAQKGARKVVSGVATSYAESAVTGKPTILAEQLLQQARDTADRTVTVSSTAYSAHPVKVEIEREGVVLALYGKVELEAQREEIERALLSMPGVIDVKNFLVAEDALLNAVNATVERLKAAGKLEGADVTALVENYIVSLYGNVPNAKMKEMLEREIVGIPGVRVVINHIGLNEDIPGNLGRTRNR
ncbi:MAG TPA: BON domain-containing protein [Ktedonobacteraceae bacterium]|nr:BON domain-containing protein [Ktedonobacteraceae bacterium]